MENKNDDKCDSSKVQDIEHLFACKNYPIRYTLNDFWLHEREALDRLFLVWKT